MTAEIDKKRKSRGVLRASFTRTLNDLDSLLQTEGPDTRQVEVSFEMLEPKFEEMKLADSEIYEALLENSSEDDLLKEVEAADVYKRRFVECRLRYNEFIGSLNQPSATTDRQDDGRSVVSEVAVTGRRKFKLPTIEFKRFGGDIKDWLSFWAQFKKIHEDADIDDHDKIEYLIQATIPGSRARQLVESFPAMGENYAKIVESMQSRFGREDLQIEVYVRELLKLILNNAVSQQNMQLSTLYDQIETQLRALETLGITSDKCSAMLYPLIESCLSHDLLRAWQRSVTSSSQHRTSSRASLTTEASDNGDSTLESRLQSLMNFLKTEVENEQRISLAAEGFGLSSATTLGGDDVGKKKKPAKITPRPTATDLINCEVAKCIFCQGTHNNDSCFKARKLSLEEKKKVLTENGACFRCLKIGHQSRRCRGRLQCVLCAKSHVALMCPDLPANKQLVNDKPSTAVYENCAKDKTLANHTSLAVFLQTLRVALKCEDGFREVRALIDTGSQRSYVLKATATRLGYQPKRREKLIHCLFGGVENANTHSCYDVTICKGTYSCTFEVLDQLTICNDLCPVFRGPWLEELYRKGIEISDIQDTGPIELLIGADVAGRLYTGGRHVLQCGLVAIETTVGWTLMGKIPLDKPTSSVAMTTLCLLVKEASITDLWELDALGIKEPSEKKSRSEMAAAAKDLFLQTVKVDDNGRYEVRLPWLEDHLPLPTNYSVARKRLNTTVRKLKNEQLLESYDAVFREWLAEDVIEQINENSKDRGHYLPHRPVIKGNSTTKIRPVFDASARERDGPSLNHCLEKGMNLIELIPSILLRFRESPIGVVADIRKAFLQISVSEKDRDFLKFLWICQDGNEIVYRHNRVVFGVNSSPFLLGATIEHHLSSCLEKCQMGAAFYSVETIEKLAKSFYVDNCCTSVSNQTALKRFVRESKMIMQEAKFDLRGWEFTDESAKEGAFVPVLGLIWHKGKDTLKISPESWNSADFDSMIITKRLILSMAQRVFDVIGFTCPATLVPKLMLQQIWKKQLPWDKPVDTTIESAFREWLKGLTFLQQIEIPRWIGAGCEGIEHISLHTFCDASKNAFSSVVFLRVVRNNEVSVSLLGAKARVAPLRNLTIPRLELLAAVIGARQYANIKENLECNVMQSFFWSDSSTVLSWIHRKEEWSTFVWNRVTEIRALTASEAWRHVPGDQNPADLPSRGCSPKYLFESKWWEGPRWLYNGPQMWPQIKFDCNEEEIAQERKKKLVTTLVNVESDFWHLTYFSKYLKTVRMIGWIFRFTRNLKLPKTKEETAGKGRRDELSATEFDAAEKFLFRIVQAESFSGSNDKRLRVLNPFYDEHGIIRLKSRVSNRKDIESFRFPIVLPSKHPTVIALILDEHYNASHSGIQCLLGLLREKYWILNGRRTVKSALAKCIICKRHSANSFQVEPSPLPLDRVRDATVFEVTGVDLTGPLYLNTGNKVWVCLFTCAVYRAVHLELVFSLSTHGFIQALRRFIARRGRPRTMYSDNGTNFVGTENALAQLDWEEISKNSVVQRITWRFNPPSAPWWGGFWERLIGILKRLLRKVLGRASLNYEDLLTIICDCEMVINARPLTYCSNDPNDLTPITPSVFLCERVEYGLPDCDIIDRTSLCRKLRYKQKLRDDLRRRFRTEYLGQLKTFWDKKSRREIKLGEVVLIGNDTDKRVDWPLGRVVELIPGKDNKVRLVKVDTARGQLLRPLQRLYPLECIDSSSAVETTDESREDFVPERHAEKGELPETEDCAREVIESAGVTKESRAPVTTRSGRVSKMPQKFDV